MGEGTRANFCEVYGYQADDPGSGNHESRRVQVAVYDAANGCVLLVENIICDICFDRFLYYSDREWLDDDGAVDGDFGTCEETPELASRFNECWSAAKIVSEQEFHAHFKRTVGARQETANGEN